MELNKFYNEFASSSGSEKTGSLCKSLGETKRKAVDNEVLKLDMGAKTDAEMVLSELRRSTSSYFVP